MLDLRTGREGGLVLPSRFHYVGPVNSIKLGIMMTSKTQYQIDCIPRFKPTPAMLKWFGRANGLGQIACTYYNGRNRNNWHRCMKRAAEWGYVSPNAYGEYELTPLGHRVLAASRAR